MLMNHLSSQYPHVSVMFPSCFLQFRGDDGCITGCVWDLSQRTKGCRRVQQALEDPGVSDAARSALALELKGKVRQCARSACGNYVLQKFIQVLSALA